MINTTEQELKTAIDRVRFLLEKYERAREDDTYLCWLYAVIFEGVNRIPFEDFQKLMNVNFETITRARRKIQNEYGLFLPKDPTILGRRRKEREVRSVITKL